MLAYAVPLFLVLVALEWALSRRRAGVRGYEGRDTAASLAMGLGNSGAYALTGGAALAGYAWIHAHAALFEIRPDALWAWAILIPAEDLCYYTFHRAHHRVRLLWAAHVNHHSSRHFNLSTALRQSWTTPLTGPIFWAPLALLGFPPLMIVGARGVSLLHQFWIHTELVGRLGPLEQLFNTPSHHRVHHGRNARYLDRNYAGIFIVWDRLLGTFEPEGEPVDYGLTRNLHTFHPVRIAFHEWRAMLREARAAGSPGGALRVLLRPPERALAARPV